MTGDIVYKEKMIMGDLSDIQVADKVRMLMRSDLEHEWVCTGARDRIMYLSQQVEKMEDRERRCPTMLESEARAILKALQEIAEAVGLDSTNSPWETLEKPLFVPLKTEFFEAFKSGEKIDELRKYGKRWNEKTCRVGRPVVISKGYGKHARMQGVVSGFCKQLGSTFSDAYRKDIKAVYGTDEVIIAMVRITELRDI